ncbi:GL24042 [Drosophila persimilis]|uniref:GL24042 n=1 Tax=Drosophila persimilis TaxID=7234 RepID=B4G362_DROPE|nr:akirin [Drosophila persimilis]EDW24257.1 GL24042 [Drosophila persimilis]
MASATLKRGLDRESMNQRPPKRRRCNPFGQSAVPSRDRDGPTISSVLAQTPSNRFAKDRFEPSPFSEAALAQMSPDKMAKNLCNEIKRLHKGKQLPITAAAIERMQNSESSGSEMGSDSPPNLMRHCEKALFTFQQVQLICEGMIKERENQLRERYESVLTTKLHKQHDAFVKFTYDQIQCRYKAAPSYLS